MRKRLYLFTLYKDNYQNKKSKAPTPYLAVDPAILWLVNMPSVFGVGVFHERFFLPGGLLSRLAVTTACTTSEMGMTRIQHSNVTKAQHGTVDVI